MIKILFLMLPTLLFSCIWIDGTTIDGKHTYLDGRDYFFIPRLKHDINFSTPSTKLKEIIEKHKDKKSSPNEEKEFNAVVSMLKGDYNKSINSLLELNKIEPNRYSIASNLGTAYELNKDPKEALKWISEGIKRDPNSHYGTEWLHVLILKTKLKLQRDTNYLKKHHIIALPDKFKLEDNVTVDKKIIAIKNIKSAIFYQLNERVIFIKPKNSIVADLLYTLARIEAQTSNVEQGIELLKLSKEYGFLQTDLLENKMKQYISIRDTITLPYIYGYIKHNTDIVAFVVLMIFLLLLLLKKIKEAKKSENIIRDFLKGTVKVLLAVFITIILLYVILSIRMYI